MQLDFKSLENRHSMYKKLEKGCANLIEFIQFNFQQTEQNYLLIFTYFVFEYEQQTYISNDLIYSIC